MAKFCQALAHTKSSERIGEIGLCCTPSCADVSETVAVAFPCQNCAGVLVTVVMDLSCQSCADDLETVAMAMLCQSCAEVSDSSYGCTAPKLFGRIETVAKALRCQSSALSSEQPGRPRLRLALS